MPKQKGLFVVFEGVEGSGKSYQSEKLFNYLKKKKFRVIKTREPGGTKSSELIRNLILKDYFAKNQKDKFDKYTDTLLYLAARNEHVINKILPELNKRKIVICDRFIDSTYAYQVHGKKIKKKFIDFIHKFILRGIKPDIVFILKSSIKSTTERLKKRRVKNRYDKFSKTFYSKAQRAFIRLASKKINYYVLDSSKNTNDLEKKIRFIVKKKYDSKQT